MSISGICFPKNFVWSLQHTNNFSTLHDGDFVDLVENIMKVFMDDFLVFGNSFDHCLRNLSTILERCKTENLVLNWEKCHFMVCEGIVLRHRVSKEGLEVDKAKISTIENLAPPTMLRGEMFSWS